MASIPVAIEDATTRQLAAESVRLMHSLHSRLDTLEIDMSNLTAAVEGLKSAVDGVAQRLLPQIETLKEALAAAQSNDAADAAAIATALSEASAAVEAIEAETTKLNALGAEPSTPIEEVPENDTVQPEDVADVIDVDTSGETGDAGTVEEQSDVNGPVS